MNSIGLQNVENLFFIFRTERREIYSSHRSLKKRTRFCNGAERSSETDSARTVPWARCGPQIQIRAGSCEGSALWAPNPSDSQARISKLEPGHHSPVHLISSHPQAPLHCQCRHAAPPAPPVLRGPGHPPLPAAAVRRLRRVAHGAVRLLLLGSVFFVVVGRGGRAAGGECAQLRDGGLRATAGAAVEQPIPSRGGVKRRPPGGADARGLGRGRAPP